MNIYKFFVFIFLFLFFNNTLLAVGLKQVIVCENNIISSSFLIHDNPDSADEIELKNFEDEETDIYRNFLIFENNICNLEQAEKLFNEILLRKDIPFAYTDDGCFARAHVIATHLSNMNIQTGKIWITGGDIINPSDNGCKWDYHVAATIGVKVADNIADNIIETLVIDPSPVNKQLLTIEEWLNLHQIKTFPKIVCYPLPANNFPETTLISFSSHLAFYPFKIDLDSLAEDDLEEASDVNLDNFNNID
jgi:hypothetical protein